MRMRMRIFNESPGPKHFVRLLYSLVISIVPVIAAFYSLKAKGPLSFVITCLVAAQALFFIRAYARKHLKLAATAVLVCAFVFSALLIYLLVILVPFPVYKAWLTVAGRKVSGGSISFLFVIGIAFFGCACAGASHTRGYVEPAFGLACIMLLLVTIIFQTALLSLAGILFIAFFMCFLLIKRNLAKPRTLFYAIALLACAGFVSLVFTCSFRFENSWFVNMRLYPGFRNMLVRGFSNSAFVSALSGYGYSFESIPLAEKPEPSDEPLFRIASDPGRILYLRCGVYGTYDSSAWRLSSDPSASGKAADNQPDTRGDPEDSGTKITVLADFFPVIPHTLCATGLSIPGMGELRLYGNMDTGFALALPLILENEISIREESESGDNVRARIERLLEKNIGQSIDSHKPANIEDAEKYLKPYLAVPGFLVRDLSVIAVSAASGRNTGETKAPEWKKILDIYRYLSDNYGFTLDIQPDRETDFVSDFLLRGKKGYSAHFASAFVILCRLNRIPARYVTGFLCLMPESASDTVISGYNAHAWAEVWINGLGWVNMETCPFMDPRFRNDPEYYARFNSEGDIQTEMTLRALMGDVIKPPLKKKIEPGTMPLLEALSAILAIAISAGAVFAVRRALSHRVRLAGPSRRIYFIARRLANRFRTKGIRLPSETGWRAWMETHNARYPLKKRIAQEALSIIEKSFYAKSIPTAQDAKSLRELAEKLL